MPEPTICPLCDQPIMDGDRRVSWFAKTGDEVTERGATHLICAPLPMVGSGDE